MSDHYILIDHRPVREPDVIRWAEWFNAADRKVKREYVGMYLISTVFLGLDHRFSGKGPPILFETMVFPQTESLSYQTRCATWTEAEDMHDAAVAAVRRMVNG